MSNIDSNILISRVVDGVASPEDWGRLEQAAAEQPGVWRELAMAHRQHGALVAAMGPALASADLVELPNAGTAEVVDEERVLTIESGRRRRTMSVAWAGWAVAAGLALAFTAASPTLRRGGADQASLTPALVAKVKDSLTPAEAFDIYRTKGQLEGLVVDELSEKILLGFEEGAPGRERAALIIRPVVERAPVSSLACVSQDESGQHVVVPLPEEQLMRLRVQFKAAVPMGILPGKVDVRIERKGPAKGEPKAPSPAVMNVRPAGLYFEFSARARKSERPASQCVKEIVS